MSITTLSFIPAALLIACGIAVMAVGTLGIFRIKYVLNRLHSAAMGDSLGLLLIALGLMIIFGWTAATAKLVLMVILFWLAAPVCSHLLSSLEVETNGRLTEACEIMTLDELNEEINRQED